MTYKDLLSRLQNLNEEQLSQSVVITDGDGYHAVYSLQLKEEDDEGFFHERVALSCVAGTAR